jgi:Isochorismatase family
MILQNAYGLEIPQTLEEACHPHRLALIVYDMQLGVVRQISNGAEVTAKVVEVLRAARQAGIRIFFTRHMSLPRELMGVFQLRMAMAWQRVGSVDEVKPWFLRRYCDAAPKRGPVVGSACIHSAQQMSVPCCELTQSAWRWAWCS